MEHPITPPPELVGQWTSLANEEEGQEVWSSIATQAARWGADQQLKLDAEQIAHAYQAGADRELEACCEWLRSKDILEPAIDALRAARRPKPPSLKDQALRILAENGTTLDGRIELEPEDIPIIRRALEALPND